LSMFLQHSIKVTESERQSDISSILPFPNRGADHVLPFMLGSSFGMQSASVAGGQIANRLITKKDIKIADLVIFDSRVDFFIVIIRTFIEL